MCPLSRPRRVFAGSLLALLMVSWIMANRGICVHCTHAEVNFVIPDGSRVIADLILPEAREANIPCVIVAHGYLANRRFMAIPWVADLIEEGLAVLLVDRHGAGSSDGELWPYHREPTALDDLEPALRAAVEFARRQPGINRKRIGLLGHSDGGTAALMVGSADWDIAATVAISASVAPAHFVNHVAPQNLLLVYGTEDRFILKDTDITLIRNATRGVLDGEGHFGTLQDGSGRRLIRVPGAGHLSVLYDNLAVSETVYWLKLALGVTMNDSNHSAASKGSGWWWVWTGCGAMTLLIGALFQPPWEWSSSDVESHGIGQQIGCAITVGSLWALGVAASPFLANALRGWIPSREGSVFVAVSLGPALILWISHFAVCMARRTQVGIVPPPSIFNGDMLSGIAIGMLIATAVFVACNLLLLEHYELARSVSRAIVALVVGVGTLPGYVALEVWIAKCRGWVGYLLGEALVAAVTAVISGQLFERMLVVPGYLTALTIVVYLAAGSITSPRMAMARTTGRAMTIAWLAGVVCTLY